MVKANRKEIYRIMDANLNRFKEGLRVCEDVCRFVLDERSATRQLKDMRHRTKEVVASLGYKKLVEARDIRRDVGKGSNAHELTRGNVGDIFFANASRMKESIRVLEEFSKLLDKKTAGELKNIRYQFYALEKRIAGKL
ncbi:MAG TPA: thiamine-phosphate pyrophosphorylase [Candidatus Omnitrophota bacterium]|nr:thiamine-phosphate pyrophosphorylase [Candidatus Omnitrophota bacterium]